MHHNLQLPIMRLPGSALLRRLGWTTAGFGYGQGIRLVGNVVMTRLLAPEIFGIMLIVNTLRTGMELLTDIGVGQNIVADRRGETPDFYNTAWTLQAVRGIILSIAFAIAAMPLSALYGGGVFLPVLQLSALFLLVSGFQSVGRYIAQRRQQARALALFEMTVATTAMAVQILLAWMWPTIWALVFGALVSGLIATIASYWIVPGIKMRLHLDRNSLFDILHFSKWIFLSSIVFFVATNFDRLYLGTAIPLALLGVFGIARGLADMVGNLVIRVGNMVVFPAIAGARQNSADIRAKLGELRVPLLISAALCIAALVAVSDTLVKLIYDARYHAAAAMLPVLAVGLWFTVLATISEAILLGVGKPIYGTIANFAKLGWMVVMIPAGVVAGGIGGAVLAIALGDLVRYIATLLGQTREGLAFVRQDIMLTAVFALAVFALRALTGALGLTDGWALWWPAIAGVLP